jgi:hypothetical protein
MNTSMRGVDGQSAHPFGSLRAKANRVICVKHALHRVLREAGHAFSLGRLGILFVIAAFKWHMGVTP